MAYSRKRSVKIISQLKIEAPGKRTWNNWKVLTGSIWWNENSWGSAKKRVSPGIALIIKHAEKQKKLGETKQQVEITEKEHAKLGCKIRMLTAYVENKNKWHYYLTKRCGFSILVSERNKVIDKYKNIKYSTQGKMRGKAKSWKRNHIQKCTTSGLLQNIQETFR